MKLLQMHATAYGFPSTGAKNFFGRNSDIADRLVPERKFLCKVFDMSYKNVDIQPHEHDILMGRGGKNNQHSGNEKLRELARVQAKKYSSSTKKGKSILSRILVKQMRELDPPARFLKKDQASGIWEEVGEDTAREKASQVLRDAVAQLEASEASDKPETAAANPELESSVAVHPNMETSAQLPRRRVLPDEATPALQSITSSWSSSTPRSHESPDRNKRRRLSLLSPPGPYFSYPPYHDSLLQSPLRLDAWQYQPSTFPSGHFSFPSMPHPARLPSQQPPPPSPPRLPFQYSQSALHYGRHLQNPSVRRMSIGSSGRTLDPLDPNFTDFDLFQGELLECDIEEINDAIHPNPPPF